MEEWVGINVQLTILFFACQSRYRKKGEQSHRHTHPPQDCTGDLSAKIVVDQLLMHIYSSPKHRGTRYCLW